MAHPGKKLLFMGQEFAQRREWSHERSLDWHLLEQPLHHGMRALVRDLNAVYRERPALWTTTSRERASTGSSPTTPSAACWPSRAPPETSQTSWRSRSPHPGAQHEYRIGLPREGRWVEAVNTDSTHYGGSDVGNLGGVVAEAVPWGGQPFSAQLSLPPLGGLWLVPEAAA